MNTPDEMPLTQRGDLVAAGQALLELSARVQERIAEGSMTRLSDGSVELADHDG